jgi:signal peptidase I
MLTIQMMRLSLVIVRDAQSRGGLLLHGALAENGSTGVILTGPAQVGKTTASRRLPPPWHSLCDDAALIVNDRKGYYRAHPWPTWSRLYSDGPGGSWDVQRAVPLRAIFFLAQSRDNRVSHIDTGQAIAMLMESVQQVSRTMTRTLKEPEIRALHREQLAAASRVARTIPIYMLHISLNGNFWKEIERVASDVIERPAPIQPRPVFTTAALEFEKSPGHPLQYVMYTGPSMNPTCRDPDLLEVIPYGDRPVRRGDIIYFRPPGSSYSVVHRVIRVTSGGICTRGDNNTENDPYLVQPSDIDGKVVSAWRGRRLRRIAGGWRGYFIQYWIRLRRIIYKMIAKVLKKLYKRIAKTGIFRHLLVPGHRPHVVAFETKHQTYFKLMMGRRVVGRCDRRQGTWRIRFPFHLFVDETALPTLCSSKENPGKKARECQNS